MSDPDNANRPTIILARWSDRFIAWLIDAVILTILASALLIGLSGVQDFSVVDNGTADITSYTISGGVFFAYFIAMEYRSGQTIGKKILNIRLVGMDGGRPSLAGVAVSSLGKAFILPLDVVIGWIATNDKRQRICNKLGDTIVVKIKETEYSDLKYVKD